MSLLDRVLRTFNIGGLGISVETEADTYPQGSRVRGTVHVTAGKVEQREGSLVVRLREHWPEARHFGQRSSTFAVTRTQQELCLAEELLLSAGDAQSFHFDLALPLNARLTAPDTGWYLEVFVGIVGAIDPVARVPLQVVPAHALRAVVDSVEAVLRFEEQTRARTFDPVSSMVWFRLLPPKVLAAELDDIRIGMMREPDGSVAGKVVFDLQEKSVGDYFKAVLKEDLVHRWFKLSFDELFVVHQEVAAPEADEAETAYPSEQVHRHNIARKIGDLMKDAIQTRA